MLFTIYVHKIGVQDSNNWITRYVIKIHKIRYISKTSVQDVFKRHQKLHENTLNKNPQDMITRYVRKMCVQETQNITSQDVPQMLTRCAYKTVKILCHKTPCTTRHQPPKLQDILTRHPCNKTPFQY